jgi:peptidyl-Lys metalloendopeptidase
MSAMKKFQVKWLALGVVSAFAFAGCVAQEGDEGIDSDVGGADVALDPVAGEVTVQLSVDKTTVNSTERVVVKITLTNESDHAVRFLSWYAPGAELEENLFSVTRGTEAVEFVGPHYKRPTPVTDDFVVLRAGKSVTREVDLTDFYDFSKSADYNIKYSISFLREGAQESVALDSNQVGVWVMERTNTVQEKPSAGDTMNLGAFTFTKCTTDQANTASQALNAASTMANGANTYLGGSPSGTPRFTTWFGAYSSNAWNTAKSHYVAIKDAIDTKPVSIDCGCKKTYYAYVYPNQPYNIYVCKAFWTAPMSGTDSKGGTLIHELSHFDIVAGTDDWVYGQSGAKSLAISDPTKALNNADSHEYFAENTPSQN